MKKHKVFTPAQWAKNNMRPLDYMKTEFAFIEVYGVGFDGHKQ